MMALIRDFYTQFERLPAQRILIKLIREKLGNDKGSLYFKLLFPKGLSQLCRLSGLPNPSSCIEDL